MEERRAAAADCQKSLQYGVKTYVDNMKQWFIDHRLTPKSVLWSGGLTSNGGGPYIDHPEKWYIGE